MSMFLSMMTHGPLLQAGKVVQARSGSKAKKKFEETLAEYKEAIGSETLTTTEITKRLGRDSNPTTNYHLGRLKKLGHVVNGKPLRTGTGTNETFTWKWVHSDASI